MTHRTLPFDPVEVISTMLEDDRRPPDGLLHPSMHLVGSLRHAQLDIAGAPKIPNPLVAQMRLMSGNFWHRAIHDELRRRGIPYIAEADITPWIPEGWAGKPDALVVRPMGRRATYALLDVKTQKGEGMRFLAEGGAKDEHIWQTSMYWHGARRMGLPMGPEIVVLYLPFNEVRGRTVEPLLIPFEPIPWRQLDAEARRRRKAVHAYEDSLPFLSVGRAIRAGVALDDEQATMLHVVEPDKWLTPALAPEQERVQKLRYDRVNDMWELLLVPHWSAAYCEFPDELCGCRNQGQTKLGTFDRDGTYYERTGYEHIRPEIEPDTF